jgi:hypothetical protein
LALPLREVMELDRMTVRPGVEFEDLPEHYQRLILEAEAYYAARRRERAGEAEQSGAAAPGTREPVLGRR